LFTGKLDDINLMMGLVTDENQDFIPCEFHILELLNNLLKEQMTYLASSDPAFDVRVLS